MLKNLIVLLLLCLLVAGCGGSRENCDYAAGLEYGEDNVVFVGCSANAYVYLAKTPTKVLIIYKGNDTNPKTTKTNDVTNFVRYKGETK